jgi:fructose-1-phosphate kinase PfkB-like protein
VMACEQYGQSDRVTLLQFVGGITGNFITQVLSEKNIHQVNIPTKKATRTCTTILDKYVGDMTELIEPTGLISNQERELLEKKAETLIYNGKDTLQAIALCGTFPTGITGSTYARIARAKPDHIILLLDAYKDVTEILSTGKVNIFKINHEELISLVREIEDKNDLFNSFNVETLSIPELAFIFLKKYHIPILGITDGPNR